MALDRQLLQATLMALFGALVFGPTCSPQQTARPPDPLLVPALPELRQRMKEEIETTQPDYIVFVPQITNAQISDTGNEHFLVFDGPDGSLMAIWTQSTHEGQPDQHIVFSQSEDEGDFLFH